MNRVFPGRRFFTAAYVLLAVGFLTIHFTRVENFSAVVGGVVVKGRSSVGTSLSPPQIRRLSVRANGADMAFRKSDRAVLITDDGIRHPLDIQGWESDGDSLTIAFSQGTAVTLRTDHHGSDIALVPEVPTTEPPVRSLELPFRPGKAGGITPDPNDPGSLSISTPDTEYLASLPSDSSWNPENGRLDLVVLDKADPVLVITDDKRGSGLGAVEWMRQGAAPSPAAYDAAVEGWLTLAREGWRTALTAYSPEIAWDDSLAAAVLADATAHRDLPTRLQEVVSFADRSPSAIGWLPSPYLGNIVNQSRAHTQEMSAEARRLSDSIRSGSPLIGTKSALTVLLDTSASSDVDALLETARRPPPRDIANQDAVDLLRVLHEAVRLSRHDPTSDPAVRRRLFDEILIPRIFWVKDGLWLVEEDGSIDMELNVTVAALLMEEAQWNNDSLYQGIGRQMMLSALAYAAENGSLPAKILFEADGEVVRRGSVRPEGVYPLVIQAAAYPRHISLAGELGPGSWALTCAERFTVRGTPRETTVTMDFPAGSIHHIAIKGIKRFQVLYMNGIRWNGDPNFQRYYAGWNYDEANETLYVKIRHRTVTETIRILHYDPDAAASPAPAAAAAAEAG